MKVSFNRSRWWSSFLSYLLLSWEAWAGVRNVGTRALPDPKQTLPSYFGWSMPFYSWWPWQQQPPVFSSSDTWRPVQMFLDPAHPEWGSGFCRTVSIGDRKGGIVNQRTCGLHLHCQGYRWRIRCNRCARYRSRHFSHLCLVLSRPVVDS